MQKRIVIADDDPTMCQALNEALSTAGYQTFACPNGEEAERVIQQQGADLVISDVRMPGLSGLDLLKRSEKVPFIMISGHATVPEAVEAMKMGAYDFVVKPFSYREILSLVEAGLGGGGEEETSDEDSGEIVTSNPRMKSLLKFAAQVAKSHASVLIQGESGTGKELLARYIHSQSRRRNGPFVAVNCAALPEGLLESEMFGHERGAFTGAVVSKPGKFELAHNGTLLLDEVSEMPLPLQAKLLRVLQEREVDRIGGKRPLRVDVRVLSTTNRDLKGMIRCGSFREDLFYRLNVVPLRLPPLRERVDDIEPLARAFFGRKDYRKAALSPRAVARLTAHPWRGNIRELFNVLERAVIIARGEAVDLDHLLLEGEVDKGIEGLAREAAIPDRQGAGGPAPGEPLPPREDDKIQAGVSVQEMEERLIFKTLAEVNDNRTRAARLLGISVRTLRNKLKQYQTRPCQEEG